MCTVIDPGMLTTVQDLGRPGYRAFGMPLAGAMDRYAFTMANILAGNGRNAAALEMTLRGARFRFSREAYVAICGADMQPRLNGTRVHNWSAFHVPADSELALDHALNGCRTYLAFCGGVAVPAVMGSRSTYLRAHIGGHHGRALNTEDTLLIAPTRSLPSRSLELSQALIPILDSEAQLRVMPGPQDDIFTGDAMLTFLQSTYTLTHRNDRMGFVLEGPPIAHKAAPDIVSDALCPGAIQVPGNGMPVILAADCQTTGGYAKIATVIGPDLAKLAQLKAGDTVRFAACSDEEAVAALVAERDCYARAEVESKPC